MSVLTREKKVKVLQPGTVNVTTDLNPVVPGAIDVSGTLEPRGVVTATPLPQAGGVSQTALPIAGSINVSSPYGEVEGPTRDTAKVDEDGCPI